MRAISQNGTRPKSERLSIKTAASAPVVIGEVSLNSRDVLRVSLGEYEGRRTIDARKFYRREDGSLCPTPKGLTLALDRLPALAEMVSAALDRARADGLLPSAVVR